MIRVAHGEPIARIARSLGMKSRSPLYREAARRGIPLGQVPRGHPPIPPEKQAEVLRVLAELGGKLGATARQTGVSRWTVRKYRDL